MFNGKLNFVIYYCIVELEEEINDIIKIIYSLQFNYNNEVESKVEKFVNSLNNSNKVTLKNEEELLGTAGTLIKKISGSGYSR